MLILSSKLIGMPIGSLTEQKMIGRVKSIVFNPENGDILAFVVASGTIFKSIKILSARDLLDIDKTGLVTKSEENICDLDDLIREKKIINKKITLVGQKALSESKKQLGKIFDVLIETNELKIIKFYIRSWFHEIILPANKVVKINEKGVFFSDDVIESTPVAEPEGAAA